MRALFEIVMTFAVFPLAAAMLGKGSAGRKVAWFIGTAIACLVGSSMGMLQGPEASVIALLVVGAFTVLMAWLSSTTPLTTLPPLNTTKDPAPPEAQAEDPPPLPPPASDSSNWSLTKMWLLLGGGVIVLMSVFWISKNTERADQPRAAADSRAVAGSTARSGNRAHDAMVGLSTASQIAALEVGVLSAGYRCVGQRAFFMGLGERNSALWSIQCSGGKSYLVTIEADSVGSSKVLDCEFLKLAKMSCFEKL